MVKASIFTNKELKFLKELVKNKVDFMIVGLSAAALQGAPVVTQDIDLWFKDLSSPNLQQALKKVGGTYVPSFGLNPPVFAGKNLELFDIVLTLHGLQKFEEEVKGALEISFGKFMLKVLPLDRIIQSKKTVNRQKDKLVVPVLEDALQTIKKLKGTSKNYPSAVLE